MPEYRMNDDGTVTIVSTDDPSGTPPPRRRQPTPEPITPRHGATRIASRAPAWCTRLFRISIALAVASTIFMLTGFGSDETSEFTHGMDAAAWTRITAGETDYITPAMEFAQSVSGRDWAAAPSLLLERAFLPVGNFIANTQELLEGLADGFSEKVLRE